MLRFPLFLLLFFASNILHAQKNVEFDKANFPNRKQELKEALQDIEDGDYYFAKGRQSISLALNFYIRANDFNPNNAELNFKIAKCYLRALPESKALYFLEKAKELAPNVSAEYDYILGQACQRNLMFDKAIEAYNSFQASLNPENYSKYREDIERRIAECKMGKEMIANPVHVFIDNLGAAVNSEYADYWPVINLDETRLYFTSRRKNTVGGKIDYNDEQYYEDI